MHRTTQYGARQGGMSLVGLILIIGIVGFIGLLGMKIVPTYAEYRAVSSAVARAKTAGSTVREIQTSFDNSASAAYIESINGRDLIIQKTAEGFEVSFAYEKKIPLVGPASLVLDYAGTTAKSGTLPQTAAAN
jgi:hypothetical protein